MSTSLDFLAFEPQFLDHLAPVWNVLPDALRGRFIVDETLQVRAASKGIDAEALNGGGTRHIKLPDTRPPTGRKAVVASYGDTKIGRRLGYGDFAFLEHGIGQSYSGQKGLAARHGSYSGGIDRDDASLFMVPNEHSAERWRRAYATASVAIVGCPKLDGLPPRAEGPGPVVAVTFHWSYSMVPETLPAVGHFRHAIPELANRYEVIGHAHPKGDWPRRMRERYRAWGIEFVPDFEEVCRRADLLIADNTSVLYEFAATDRPVVVLNAPGYRQNVDHGLRFWEAAHVGENVWDPDELGEVVDYSLGDPWQLQKRRDDALAIVYAYRAGGAQRAADALRAWVGAAEAVAA